MQFHPVTLAYPIFCIAGLVLAGFCILVFVRSFRSLVTTGLLLLALAAGGPKLALHPPGQIDVLVDLSPSTRSAQFRDRYWLMQRVHELVGTSRVHLIAFSDHFQALPEESPLRDLPCDATDYKPTAADAIVLFSDGQFPLPEAGPATYPVIDHGLIEPPDAAVADLRVDGQTAVAEVRNNAGERQLKWTGTSSAAPVSIGSGRALVAGGTITGQSARAQLAAGDLWPENDSMTLSAEPPAQLQYWWIGEAAPSGWRAMSVEDFPADPTAFLSAGAIALGNVPASALSDSQQAGLAQYVRDLSGNLLIFGGDHAFGAGAYSGTPLDALSPLASDPPVPQRHWILLIDSSGSMADVEHGQSHWSAAVDALMRVLPAIPPHDDASIGSFARDLNWWINSRPAGEVAKSAAVPPQAGPGGPTNLQPVLEALAKSSDKEPREVVLLTDADVQLDNPMGLAGSLKGAGVRVSLMSLASVGADNPVLRIVNATGGKWAGGDDSSRWAAQLSTLVQSVGSASMELRPVSIRFASSLSLPARVVGQWNRTWQKDGATSLGSGALDGESIPLAALQRAGLGTVVAMACTPNASEVAAITQTVLHPPRDPRLKITWECGRSVRVIVDAVAQSSFLNACRFSVNLPNRPPVPLDQVGPGEYAAEFPSPREPVIATLQLAGNVVDRRSIPGTYPAEFDHIGNHDAALGEIARRTGGRVIAPTDHQPIDFGWPAQRYPITSYLAAAGAACLAAGIIRARR
jgi:hypothetical protein